MNVKQALKQKNKLVTELKAQYQILQKFNSIEEGNPRRYSMANTLSKAQTLQLELVELKSKIHRANAPMFEKIFEMSELKSNIKALQKLDCTEGKSNRDRYRMESELVLTSEISLVDRNEFIKKLEDRIEQIQDEMDVFNSNTEI